MVFQFFNQKKPIIPILSHSKRVLSMDISPNSKFIASGGFDYLLKIAQTEVAIPIINFNYHQGPINCIKFDHNSSYIASSSYDLSCFLWSYNHPDPLRVFFGHAAPITSLVFK